MTDPTFTRRQALSSLATLGAGSLGWPGSARAQAWPSKPIRLVLPFAPGGSSEIVARATAAELSKLLGQTVQVDNKPGGGGNVAMGEVARADDQHTLILGHIGRLAVNPNILDKLPQDPVKDFRAISLLAKSKPGRLDAAAVGAPAVFQHIRAGKLRCIATGTPQRIAQLPELPTVAEQGYPGFEMTQCYGLLAPASLAPAAVERLATAAAKAMQAPEALARLQADAAIAVGSTPAEFARFIAGEQQRWKPVLLRAKVKPD